MSSKDRRKFLRNISLASFSVLAIPKIGRTQAETKPSKSASAACKETTPDFYGQGPFYTPNAPVLLNDRLADLSELGDQLTITGRVYNNDCTEALPNTIIDIWHADHNGDYDNSGFHLRGKTTTNAQGFYVFHTIKPGKYLNGGAYRPSHIHFKITPPGQDTLTTQLYFEGDPDNTTDPASSPVSGIYDARDRIIPLTNNGGMFEGTWDIIVDGDGIKVGVETLHLERGMFYTIAPNPFVDQLEICYGVFQRGKVGVKVHDLSGNLVALLEEEEMMPAKYRFIWSPPAELPKGIYFIILEMNGLQLNYKKIVRR
jgi:protocatechuate 3,4-dioxygenase beta subunit